VTKVIKLSYSVLTISHFYYYKLFLPYYTILIKLLFIIFYKLFSSNLKITTISKILQKT